MQPAIACISKSFTPDACLNCLFNCPATSASLTHLACLNCLLSTWLVYLQMNAKMRAILVDWLVEVAEEYKLCADTLYLTINFIDRFLSVHIVQRSHLQLVGVACMWVAAKYEEVHPPNVADVSDLDLKAWEMGGYMAMLSAINHVAGLQQHHRSHHQICCYL